MERGSGQEGGREERKESLNEHNINNLHVALIFS